MKHVCIYIYTYTYTYTHTSIHPSIHTYIHTYRYTYIYMYVYIYIYIVISYHIYIICVCIHMYMASSHLCLVLQPFPPLEAAPGRFLGVASGDIRDPVRCVAGIKHYVQKHGFVAVRMLGTTGWDGDDHDGSWWHNHSYRWLLSWLTIMNNSFTMVEIVTAIVEMVNDCSWWFNYGSNYGL